MKTETVIDVGVPKRRITIGYEDYCIKWVYEKKIKGEDNGPGKWAIGRKGSSA